MDINRLGMTQFLQSTKSLLFCYKHITQALHVLLSTIPNVQNPANKTVDILHLGSYHRVLFILKLESLLNQVTSCWFFPPEHFYSSTILKTHIHVFHMLISFHFLLSLLLFSIIDLLVNINSLFFLRKFIQFIKENIKFIYDK